jgi:hypothetical protein
VDTGRLAESWDEAGAQLQKAVPRGSWPRAVAKMRPIERPLTRRATRVEMRPNLPGEREGEYVILRFRTTFAAPPTASARQDDIQIGEAVTARRDGTRGWRVAGYQVYAID